LFYLCGILIHDGSAVILRLLLRSLLLINPLVNLSVLVLYYFRLLRSLRYLLLLDQIASVQKHLFIKLLLFKLTLKILKVLLLIDFLLQLLLLLLRLANSSL